MSSDRFLIETRGLFSIIQAPQHLTLDKRQDAGALVLSIFLEELSAQTVFPVPVAGGLGTQSAW